MDLIKKEVQKAVEALYAVNTISFSVDFPNDLQFGDFATNIALLIAKQLKKNPADLASDIAGYIITHSSKEFTETFSEIRKRLGIKGRKIKIK